MSKLDDLLDNEGLTFEEAIDEYGYDSINPGICMNNDCDYTTIVEPDCTKGWCEHCKTNSVQSMSILMGVI